MKLFFVLFIFQNLKLGKLSKSFTSYYLHFRTKKLQELNKETRHQSRQNVTYYKILCMKNYFSVTLIQINFFLFSKSPQMFVKMNSYPQNIII